MKHLTDSELSAFLDGALAPAVNTEAERHLESCPDCRQSLAALESQDGTLRRMLTHDPGDAHFEQLAARIEASIARGDRPVAAGLLPERLAAWLGSPRRLALASAVAVVAVGAGFALITARDRGRPPSSALEHRASQVAPAPLSGGTRSDQANAPAPATGVEHALEQSKATTPATRELAAPEGGSAAPVPAPSAAPPKDESALGKVSAPEPARAYEVRRNAAGEDEAVHPVVTPFRAPEASVPESATGGTRRALKQRFAQPLAGDASGAKEGLASPAAPAPSGEGATPGMRVRDQQAASVRVCGTVRDASARPIPFASVTLVTLGIGATSDGGGRFCLDAPPGEHVMSLIAVGFRPLRQIVTFGEGLPPLALTMRAVPVLEENAVRPEAQRARPSASPPASTSTASDSLDVFRALPDSLQHAAWKAQRLYTIADNMKSASRADAAAEEWERIRPRVTGGPLEVEVRYHIAEARFRAWELGPNHGRAEAATEALTAYLVRAPSGPLRRRAAVWLDNVKLTGP
jgi:hypothetical protein